MQVASGSGRGRGLVLLVALQALGACCLQYVRRPRANCEYCECGCGLRVKIKRT